MSVSTVAALMERLYYVNHFSLGFPMNAIEQIIAGYVSLKNRRALEEIRDHRKRLFDDLQTRSVPGFQPSVLSGILREEIDLVEAALARFDDDRAVSASDSLEQIETKATVGDDERSQPNDPGPEDDQTFVSSEHQ
ncbi:hypothetical protein [Bradyrhizobium septentrionale]|uniref:Uncharacterized protein n=1 Tax=Bradyrhizobium septentrionale TaxID=1404411 RepID=A0ABZ2NP15_9BRAD|nr:hypothetical protein [Bradyrhizobium septentrionale]UGY14408.1 hypothetical protein HAP48_0038590 [Bradyrhizobium septentrionale]UGY22872.1 hypothetical protein HU675_0033590 [Bradyrhizobium septentrionale]